MKKSVQNDEEYAIKEKLAVLQRLAWRNAGVDRKSSVVDKFSKAVIVKQVQRGLPRSAGLVRPWVPLPWQPTRSSRTAGRITDEEICHYA